jgi:hypothetical protein
MESLPKELQVYIFSFLSYLELTRLEIAKKGFILDSDWEIVFRKDFHPILSRLSATSWKERYLFVSSLFILRKETFINLNIKLCFSMVNSWEKMSLFNELEPTFIKTRKVAKVSQVIVNNICNPKFLDLISSTWLTNMYMDEVLPISIGKRQVEYINHFLLKDFNLKIKNLNEFKMMWDFEPYSLGVACLPFSQQQNQLQKATKYMNGLIDGAHTFFIERHFHSFSFKETQLVSFFYQACKKGNLQLIHFFYPLGGYKSNLIICIENCTKSGSIECVNYFVLDKLREEDKNKFLLLSLVCPNINMVLFWVDKVLEYKTRFEVKMMVKGARKSYYPFLIYVI